MEQSSVKEVSKSIGLPVLYQKEVMKLIYSFFDPVKAKEIKKLLKTSGWKEKKKLLKKSLQKYLNEVDYGKIKHAVNDKGNLVLSTTIFNVSKPYLRTFTEIFHKETSDKLEVEKEDMYEYLKCNPKPEFYLVNNKQDYIRVSKSLVPFEVQEQHDTDDDDNKKYELFYKMSELNSQIDFSNKDELIERQKKIMEKLTVAQPEGFFPLEFIHGVENWTIILCQGGYFSFAFFNKDNLVNHKSDHKYVIRKQAGQRQVLKDKSKKIKTSVGAQMRRENEKKHQENIECILKMNETNLEKSDAIFLFAPGFNKSIFIGEQKSLISFKKKIINIPYAVPKANYTNLMEVYKKLTSVLLEINDEQIKKILNK